MTLFTTSRPTISVKSVTRYPTRITTGTGLSYTYTNGTLNISLDYSDIPDSAQIADPANYTTVVYNKTTGALEEVQLDYIPTTIVTDPVYTRGDSNFTIPSDYRVLSLVANLTASRTWTLPLAADVTSGNRIFIYDTVGGISATNTLVIAAPSGNTINGASSITLSNAFAGITIVSNSGTQWTAILTNVDSVGGLGTNVANAMKQPVNAASGLVRLDSSGNVPALNGAALTSLNASNLGSGTVPAARLPGPSLSTIGGVKAKAAETSKFVNQIDTDGSVNLAQPAFSDISGSVDASQLPNPSATTLGGVQSKSAESNKFLTAIGTDGTVSNAQPAVSDLSGFGTGVATALGVNVGSSGAFVTNGGALGTPSSGTLTNATGLPISTGVSGLGTGVATFLATPSSANLASAVTDETGTGALVFANSPTLVTPALGTPSSGNLANCTFPTLNQNTTGTAAGLSATLVASSGGTGNSSYTIGDILYASGTTALSKLAGVATGNALISGGTGTAPSWGKVGLTTHVSGTLPVANGGTGLTSLGTGIATFLGTPTSANLAAAVTDETGTGALVFGTTPTFTTSALFPAGTVGAPGISVSGDTNTGIYFPAADTIGFVEGGVEAMRLDASGNLGLGVTPSAWSGVNKVFEFGGSGVSASLFQNNANDTWFCSNTYFNGSSWIYKATGTATQYHQIDGAHKWFTAPSGSAGNPISFTQAMTLDAANGNLLVGTTSVASGGRISAYASSNSTRAVSAVNTNSGDASVAPLYVSKFDNNSTTANVFVQFAINNQSSGSGQINANGANTAAFGSYSDKRLKENIAALPSQLPNILALKPSEFDYRDGSGHQIGFIAQEMQEVYPDVVGEGVDGMLTITGWSKTEARLVSAIQELAAKVSALESRQ